MLKDLKQFPPSLVCLSCQGCCRFKDAKSPWRPRMAEEEKGQALDEQARLPDRQGFITTVPSGEQHLCRFLDSETNVCGIYGGRPFECRLYPFLLMKNEDKAVVCAHLSCPYVQEHLDSQRFEEYVCYLKDYLGQEEVSGFLKRNPSLFGEYDGCKNEVKELFAWNC